MSKTEIPNPKTQVLNSLKGATTRGNFKLDEKSLVVVADLQKRPSSIKGNIFAKVITDETTKQAALVESDKAETEVAWNLQGRCIKGNNPLLDLVVIL